MSLECLSGCRIDESVRSIVHKVEVGSSKSFQRLWIVYCYFDRIDHKDSDVTYSCISYNVLNIGWLLDAATRS